MSDSSQTHASEPAITVLLGLPFHDLTNEEALLECRKALQGDIPGYFVTANVDFAAQAYKDPGLRTILFYARRVFCDGMPLIWISRILGHPLRERVAGSDLTPKLLEECARLGKRVYFFGSDEKTLETVTQVLGVCIPELEICGYESPPMGRVDDWSNRDIIERIRNARTDLLLVALGCPKQENWIYKYHRQTKAKLSVGIGASLDFIAGKQTRAPGWMQKTGLEWFWRMGTNPKRLFGRYARDFIFLGVVTLKQLWTLRRRPAPPVSVPEAPKNVSICVIRWQGNAERANLESLEKPEDWSRPVLLDLSAVEFIDSGGMGALAGIARQAHEHQQAFALLSPSAVVMQALKAIRMDTLFAFVESEEDFTEIVSQEESVRPAPEDPTMLKLLLTGTQEAANAERLTSMLLASLAVHPNCRRLVVDCSEVPFMDSRGICALLAARRILEERGGVVELIGLQPQVREIIRLLRLELILPEVNKREGRH